MSDNSISDGDSTQATSALTVATPPLPPPADGTVSDSRAAAKPGIDPSFDDPKSKQQALGQSGVDQEIRNEVFVRRIAGSIMGAVGIGVVATVIIAATRQINEALKPVPDGKPYLAAVAMEAHTLISLGAVWFGYQMLRAAERMFVPRRLLQDAKDVELLRALIGVDAPSTAALEQLKSITGDLPTIIKTTGEAVRSGRAVDK